METIFLSDFLVAIHLLFSSFTWLYGSGGRVASPCIFHRPTLDGI
jgi:hypothetical protein